jgi:hypothetical protein
MTVDHLFMELAADIGLNVRPIHPKKSIEHRYHKINGTMLSYHRQLYEGTICEILQVQKGARMIVTDERREGDPSHYILQLHIPAHDINGYLHRLRATAPNSYLLRALEEDNYSLPQHQQDIQAKGLEDVVLSRKIHLPDLKGLKEHITTLLDIPHNTAPHQRPFLRLVYSRN